MLYEDVEDTKAGSRIILWSGDFLAYCSRSCGIDLFLVIADLVESRLEMGAGVTFLTDGDRMHCKEVDIFRALDQDVII